MLAGFDDDPALADLTVNLARLMFPIVVVLLALSGLVVGMLNSFEHFAVPALAPAAWNLVIIAALVGLVPVLPEDDEIYAYAIGILAGTVVQFLLRSRGSVDAAVTSRSASTGATSACGASSSSCCR